ncbi:DUF257 family protein [Thermococcus pacificus]|uniref:KaiC-like domain-containing protein n=1 Tax=Thermococcus pacificus TaxID=71998 RepID=A0A218P687_9EURY|nr:DUF257 family protein [Thermococcus pacificus]ASJ06261.1 hypothetical protein A3L08_02410 [Thermococcus pacificus]
MGLRDSVMFEIWESIKMGETVLFERVGEGDMTFGFYQLLDWAEKKGFRTIIVDVLDSYPAMVSKMKLMGIETEKLSELEVIKIGGLRKRGKIIAHIENTSEPTVLVRKFREAYQPPIENPSGKVLAIIVGLEKLFAISDLTIRGVQTIVSYLASYVGMPNRLGIYFLKRDVLSGDKELSLKLLEDIATTVIRAEKKGHMIKLHIAKSLNKELEGVLLRI